VYGFGALSALFLLLGTWLFVFAHPDFMIYAAFGVVMTLNLTLSYAVGIMGKNFDFGAHQRRVAEPMPEPMVDIFLPVCGEPLDVLRNTWKHVSRLNWKNKLIYVLDDKGDPNVATLAGCLNFIYVSRPDKGVLKKAGNLRHIFGLTKAPFFVVFDADFCPHPDFLRETMPYMKDQNVAIVQTPQYFTINNRQTWIEKGAGYVQEFFYRLVQVSRDHFHAPICVGTNAVYRRYALEPFGGTYPIEYSEDVHTGFMVTDHGWRVKYIPVCLARGMCPSDLKSFFVQQYRWATGSLTLFLNPNFWLSTLTIPQKLCYLTGMLYYITTGLGVLLAPLPAMLLVWTHPELIFWYNFLFSLPAFIFGIVVFPLWHTQKFGMYSFKARTVAYYAHLFAIIDKIRGDLVPWQPTGSVGRVQRFFDFRNFLFYWTVICFTSVIFGAALQIDRIEHLIPTLFFTTFNSWVAMTALKDQ
jgi:cellulose synthase/poly-beta-1,6-N-acetylglucosamine synthase-like glycosyltransferase